MLKVIITYINVFIKYSLRFKFKICLVKGEHVTYTSRRAGSEGTEFTIDIKDDNNL